MTKQVKQLNGASLPVQCGPLIVVQIACVISTSLQLSADTERLTLNVYLFYLFNRDSEHLRSCATVSCKPIFICSP